MQYKNHQSNIVYINCFKHLSQYNISSIYSIVYDVCNLTLYMTAYEVDHNTI